MGNFLKIPQKLEIRKIKSHGCQYFIFINIHSPNFYCKYKVFSLVLGVLFVICVDFILYTTPIADYLLFLYDILFQVKKKSAKPLSKLMQTMIKVEKSVQPLSKLMKAMIKVEYRRCLGTHKRKHLSITEDPK